MNVGGLSTEVRSHFIQLEEEMDTRRTLVRRIHVESTILRIDHRILRINEAIGEIAAGCGTVIIQHFGAGSTTLDTVAIIVIIRSDFRAISRTNEGIGRNHQGDGDQFVAIVTLAAIRTPPHHYGLVESIDVTIRFRISIVLSQATFDRRNLVDRTGDASILTTLEGIADLEKLELDSIFHG